MQSGNETDSSTLSAFSASFNEDSILRQRPNISSYYCTPGRAVAKFSRRRVSIVPVCDYFGSTIPVNVIYRIFSYLNKRDLVSLMMTCKRFTDIGKESAFWKFLNLFGKNITETSLHAILDRKLKVLRLNTAIITSPPKADSDESEFSSWCSPPPVIRCALSYLDLSNAKFSNTAILNDLLERCHNLIGLSLEGVSLEDRTCAEIAKNVNLKYLNLGMTKNISSDGLMTILSGCRRLDELHIGWANFSNETVSVACGLFPPSLRKLNFSGTRDLSELNDLSVKRICENCQKLEEIDLSDDTVITEKALEYLKLLPHLKILTISRCYGIEPMSFLSLQTLEVMNVYGCLTEDGYDVLRNRLRSTGINVTPFSSIARPTVGESVSSIWGQRTRDWY